MKRFLKDIRRCTCPKLTELPQYRTIFSTIEDSDDLSVSVTPILSRHKARYDDLECIYVLKSKMMAV